MTGCVVSRLGLCIALALFCDSTARAQDADVIRIALSRNENVVYGIVSGISLDQKTVAEALAKTPVKLPDPLPAGTIVGFSGSADVFMLVEPGPRPDAAWLTVDANMNRDLRDDTRVEVAKHEKQGDGAIVRIRRAYPGTPPKETWLPYRITYEPRTNKGGELERRFYLSPTYRTEGTFRVQGVDYALELSDYNFAGRFDRSNLSRGTVLRIRPRDDPPENGVYLAGHELIPLGSRFYEVRDGALDGSWIEIARNTLPEAAIGRAVADFRLTDTASKAFHLAEYRGRYLLLDFWPSWCGPCVAEFANIKSTVEKYANQPLSIIGINLDTEKQLEPARKIVADKGLTWRQVMEGRGYFLPIYQWLGRLPENRGVFPLYAIIGPDGVVRYATNDFRKMERFLEATFSPRGNADDFIFVPLSRGPRSKIAGPLPVDFDRPAARALRQNPKLKLPANLPADARIGHLPNGIVVVARPAADANRLIVRVDLNGDMDLANEDDVEIAVVARGDVKVEEAKAFQTILAYASGAQSYMPFRFAARATAAGSGGAQPQLLYFGYDRPSSGTFVRDGVEYQVQITDPTLDLFFSPEDANAQGFLALKKKQGGKWVDVSAAAGRFQIAGRSFRLRHVHDDGQLVEFEAERQP